MDLMWFLLLGHLTGDYALQSDTMASRKGHSLWMLTSHVAIYISCIALATYAYATYQRPLGWSPADLAPLFGLIFFLHLLQDGIKGRYFAQSRQAYYADQVLHLAQLYALRLLII